MGAATGAGALNTGATWWAKAGAATVRAMGACAKTGAGAATVRTMGAGAITGAGAAGTMGSTKPSSFKSSLKPSRARDLKPLGVATASPTIGVRGPVWGPWTTVLTADWGAAQAAAKRVA